MKKYLNLSVVVALGTLMTAGIAEVSAQTVTGQGNFNQNLRTDRELIAQNVSYEELFRKASELRGVGQYQEAIAFLDQVVKLKPDSFLAWYWRGNTFTELGQYPQAITSYDEAIKIKNNHVFSWLEKGNALY